jgi:uncharacterized protein (UPF0276 family)
MQFALNYSPQAAGLLSDGVIRLDRFKCPNWPDMIAEARRLLPVYVHFSLVAGLGRLEQMDWDAVEAVLKETETPYVNLHLATAADDPADGTGKKVSESLRQRAIEQLHREVGLVVRHFGADRVIVENIPFLGVEDYVLKRHLLPTCVEPEVVSAVVREANCGFLFDLSHALMSAATLKIDVQAYIEALPLRQIREVHITGIKPVNGLPEDHMPMTDDDWNMFEWAMDKIASGEAAEPWMVAFEYGGIGKLFEWRSDAFVIATQVPRLYDTVHGVKVRN